MAAFVCYFSECGRNPVDLDEVAGSFDQSHDDESTLPGHRSSFLRAGSGIHMPSNGSVGLSGPATIQNDRILA